MRSALSNLPAIAKRQKCRTHLHVLSVMRAIAIPSNLILKSFYLEAIAEADS
ncbi:MAG: hypothetical protein F6K09_06010 [Merismopedia sp. SIO2A8]|nr:hypothetical protein [Merismopedia sp. SIO2A8]